LQHVYEEQQGKASHSKPRTEKSEQGMPPERLFDQRRELVNNSNLRNDIQVFQFQENANSFGLGGATISGVTLVDQEGSPTPIATGGEWVTLQVDVKALHDLQSVVVGFFVKDRLGQHIFGDNTQLVTLDAPVGCVGGAALRASFHFMMPTLPPGDYSVSVAVAEGTEAAHVQHEWIHDALILTSTTSRLSQGLVGIPMTRITLTALENES
jgi:lipopolysaccharide transport system ATP-binding protein